MQDVFFSETIILGSLLCFILYASYIKVIRTITANTSALYSLPDVVSTADSPTDTPTDVPDDQQRSA